MFKTKDIKLHVKEMDMNKGIVQMYVSAFDSIDSDGDVMERGAFQKTISENGPGGKNRIKHLWMHSPWDLIGRPISMKEDSTGLLVESFVSDVRNSDYRKMYRDELITEHSVGFIPVKYETVDDEDRFGFNFKEVRLMEYSSVVWGANENTPVIASKTELKNAIPQLERQMNKISKVLKDGDMTDDTMYQLQIAYEHLKSNLLTALKEPQVSTPSAEPLNFVQIFNNS